MSGLRGGRAGWRTGRPLGTAAAADLSTRSPSPRTCIFLCNSPKFHEYMNTLILFKVNDFLFDAYFVNLLTTIIHVVSIV